MVWEPVCEVYQNFFRIEGLQGPGHAACLLCSHSASSLIADCLILSVSGLTACFWKSPAAAKPLPYRSSAEFCLCWGALELPVGVSHMLEYSVVRLAASRLRGTSSAAVCDGPGQSEHPS